MAPFSEAPHWFLTLIMLGVDVGYLSGKPLGVFVALSERSAFRTRLANLEWVENWEVTLQNRDTLGRGKVMGWGERSKG
jgi:hypothetical protein